MLNGLNSSRPIDALNASHPLERSLPKHAAKQNEIDVKMLTKMQGIHAPMRLIMERKAVRNIGHLPCLHRHNALLDALTGRDMEMQFEDFLGSPIDSEKMVAPHACIEKQLGIF